jgi:hypothetical protein
LLSIILKRNTLQKIFLNILILINILKLNFIFYIINKKCVFYVPNHILLI